MADQADFQDYSPEERAQLERDWKRSIYETMDAEDREESPVVGDDPELDAYYNRLCAMCGKEGAGERSDGKAYCSTCWQTWNS